MECAQEITLSQAKQQGECLDVSITDPACDAWEGCNANICRIGRCEEAFISCTTTTIYTYESGNCIPHTSINCEGECECYVVEEYIMCPPLDCESECPFISAPLPDTGDMNDGEEPEQGGISTGTQQNV